MDPQGFMALLQALGGRAQGAGAGLSRTMSPSGAMDAARSAGASIGDLAGTAGGMMGGLPPGMGPGGAVSFPGMEQLGGLAGAVGDHPGMAAGIGGGGLLAALLAHQAMGGDEDGDEAGPTPYEGRPPVPASILATARPDWKKGLQNGGAPTTDRVPPKKGRPMSGRPTNDKGPNNGA